MMRVIVVGAGIGGLSAAIALRRQGQEVIVLERAHALRGQGAGIALFANALAGLRQLGLTDQLADLGAQARWGAIMTSNGAELIRLPAPAMTGTRAFARGELVSLLATTAGEIHFGANVTAIAQDADAVVAILADRTRERADLLVGADGINSLVRHAIAPQRAPRYAGYTAWRGISRQAVETGRFTESWGTGERFGLIDIGGGRTYWFATKNTPPAAPDDPSDRRAEILRRFSDWHAPIARVVTGTKPSAILRNDIYYLSPGERWSHGRVVLLGDAAHATTPGIGQGAAQAIEDALVLAQQLQSHPSITGALAAYTTLRRPRTSIVHRLSRRTDRAAQLASPLACQVRNLLVRTLPAGLPTAQVGQVTCTRVVGVSDAGSTSPGPVAAEPRRSSQ